MEGRTWTESCDELHTINKEVEIERIFKCVGPIWGQHEAAEKVNKYMTENNMHGQKWHWCGAWKFVPIIVFFLIHRPPNNASQLYFQTFTC